MDKKTAFAQAYRQLAVDYNTTAEALEAGGVVFTRPARNQGRRVYTTDMPFFEMATVGRTTVVMADERLRKELEAWAAGAEDPHWLFELPRMAELAGLLAPYGYELTQTHHYYLPTRGFVPARAPEGMELRWLEEGDIRTFYPNRDWPNALQEASHPERPDVLALLAVQGGKAAGMAGASIDGPGMWQIGIDVLPAYRGHGLGALLVGNLAAEIERRGALPFYSTSLAHLHSQNIAWRTGFAPAWVEVSAKKLEKQAAMGKQPGPWKQYAHGRNEPPCQKTAFAAEHTAQAREAAPHRREGIRYESRRGTAAI